jgi:oligoendopeptidase F
VRSIELRTTLQKIRIKGKKISSFFPTLLKKEKIPFFFPFLISCNPLLQSFNGGSMERNRVAEEKKWDLSSFFKDTSVWEGFFQTLLNESKEGFKKISPHLFSLEISPKELKKFLDDYFDYCLKLDSLYTFAHLKHDEDIALAENKQRFERARSLLHQFSDTSSWIEPSILEISDPHFHHLLADSMLKPYKFYLTKLRDRKKHTLSADKEQIMALSARIQTTASGAFSALSNVDLDFGSITDKDGKEHPLTQGNFSTFLKSKDRVLRIHAFERLHQKYLQFENTIAELIHGQVQSHLFNAKVRGYTSCLEAALKPNHIPVEVYHQLITTVSKGLKPLHRYISLRKRVLGLKELKGCDLYVPLIEIEEKKYSFEEACKIVIESVSILGKEYQETLSKGLYKDRWVDVFENKGKRSGAYSSGCYTSHPYILLNFHGTLNDVLTLSHEVGHSMNSFLSNKKQSYQDSSYTIFVAEVASTFNEQLTYEYLLAHAKNSDERIYILNQEIDAIRATFFRQCLFAEFELKIHEMAQQQIPLTPSAMKYLYAELTKKYFGEDFTLTKETEGEFLRIPHFYYNFYVYQYATGIAAALSLVKHVKSVGVKPYMEFLSAGGSDYSIEILKRAGIDMTQTDPINKTLEYFSFLVEKLEKEFELKEKKR